MENKLDYYLSMFIYIKSPKNKAKIFKARLKVSNKLKSNIRKFQLETLEQAVLISLKLYCFATT